MSRLIIASRASCMVCRDESADVITTRQLRAAGLVGSFRELRRARYDTVDVYVRDLGVMGTALPFTMVGSVPSAGRRRLLDGQGREVRFSRASVIVRDLPPVLLELASILPGLVVLAFILGLLGLAQLYLALKDWVHRS